MTHPDDAVLVCTPGGLMSGCHAAHHQFTRRIRTRRLPDAAVLFTAYWLGPLTGVEYFNRYYDVRDDHRLTLLIQHGDSIPIRDLPALRAVLEGVA